MPAERSQRFGRGSIPDARSWIRRWAFSLRSAASGSIPASASGSPLEGAAEVFGLELEVLAIVLDRLVQLAGVEPVTFAFGAAVDLQIGAQERHFGQTEPAARAIAARRNRLRRLGSKHPLQLFGLTAEEEDFAAVEPDALAGLADVNEDASLGHRLDE